MRCFAQTKKIASSSLIPCLLFVRIKWKANWEMWQCYVSKRKEGTQRGERREKVLSRERQVRDSAENRGEEYTVFWGDFQAASFSSNTFNSLDQ